MGLTHSDRISMCRVHPVGVFARPGQAYVDDRLTVRHVHANRLPGLDHCFKSWNGKAQQGSTFTGKFLLGGVGCLV